MPRPESGGGRGEAPLWRRLAWFAALWTMSVGALAAVAAAIRWWLHGA